MWRRALRWTPLLALVGGAVVAGGTFAPLPDNAGFETASRSDAVTITLPTPIATIRSESASLLLRAPTGIADTKAEAQDLAGLVARALDALGHHSDDADLLHALVLKTLTEGQSDAYINAVLNAALARGAFIPPQGMLNGDGTLNTDRLLDMLVQMANA